MLGCRLVFMMIVVYFTKGQNNFAEIVENHESEESDQGRERNCRTPTGEEGLCSRLSKCAFIYGRLGRIRQAECDSFRQGTGVCCPIAEPPRPRGEKNTFRNRDLGFLDENYPKNFHKFSQFFL